MDSAMTLTDLHHLDLVFIFILQYIEFMGNFCLHHSTSGIKAGPHSIEREEKQDDIYQGFTILPWASQYHY